MKKITRLMLTLLLTISVGGAWAQTHQKNEGKRKITPAPKQTQVTDKQLPPDAIAPAGYTHAAVPAPKVVPAVDAKTQKAMEEAIEMVEVDGKMMPVPPKADRSVPGNDAATSAWNIPHGIMPVSRYQNASEATNNDGFIMYGDYGGPDGGGMNDGVWYKFSPNIYGEYTITVDPDAWDCEISVFWVSNTIPNPTLSNLNYKGHKDGGYSNDEEVLTLNLYTGTTYYINIGYFSKNTDVLEGPFTLKIAGPQGNNRRGNAIEVNPSQLPYSVYQDASNAADDGLIWFANYDGPNDGMNDGVWYKFSPEVSGDYIITVDPTTNWDPEIGVFYGSPSNLHYKGHKDSGASGSTENLTLTLSSSSDYYINIGHFHNATDYPEGPFTLEINYAPPANDNCNSPITIPASPLPYSHIQYDAAGATGGTIVYSDWGGPSGSMDDGVWYRFDPANDIDYTIQVQPYNNWNPEISVFYGTCGDWVYKIHGDSQTNGKMEEVVLHNPGTYYYHINVGHWNTGSENKFEISVVSTPANDNCSDAITISPTALPYSNAQDASGATNITNPNTGANSFITYDDYGGISGGMNNGVWYKFTPTISGNYTISANPDAWDAEISVFSGSCNSMVYVNHRDGYGTNGTESLTLDLTASTTYYINIGYYHMSENRPEGEFILNLQRNATAVTGVTLTPASANLTVGETQQLTASVQPSNASNTDVNWSTSNSSIVTVDNSGLITAVSPGNATVTVTTADGGFTATCNITVEPNVINVTGVSINPSATGVTVGQTQQLNAIIQPGNATNTDVTWSSNNITIATVSSTGLVTGVAPGSAVITVTTVDGGHTATCDITVQSNTVNVTGVNITPGSISIEAGQTAQLTANIQPGNATNTGVSWASNNADVATVNSNGLVSALSAGSAVITVTTNDGGFNATCSVEVTTATIAVTGVKLTPGSAQLDVGQTLQLTPHIQPSNASNQNVNYSTSNDAIATVSSDGLVSAISPGNAVITVTTVEGEFTATCHVQVKSANVAVTGVTISPTTVELRPGETVLLTANIQPEGATNQDVSWSTNNASVATVDDNGLVTTITNGNALITVTTADGGFTDVCRILSFDAIDELSIEQLIKVYPNPSPGDIHIDASDATYELQVLDATGRLVMRKQISGLSDIHIEEAGMYFLQFSNKDTAPIHIKVIVK